MTNPVLFTRARLLSWGAAAMIALGACSSAATPTPPTAPPPTAAPPTTAPASSAPASQAPATSAPASHGSGAVYTLTVATGSGSIGKFLTGEGGKTLYTFKKDTAGAGTSACSSGTCATNWPAFTLDTGETAVGGAGASGTIATFTRADGKAQVTYNGAPLYYFAGDSKAGDTNGQGVGGFWFVAAP
jgi:predicted lipoprotein with Yx(FWY)xxD motif